MTIQHKNDPFTAKCERRSGCEGSRRGPRRKRRGARGVVEAQESRRSQPQRRQLCIGQRIVIKRRERFLNYERRKHAVQIEIVRKKPIIAKRGSAQRAYELLKRRVASIEADCLLGSDGQFVNIDEDSSNQDESRQPIPQSPAITEDAGPGQIQRKQQKERLKVINYPMFRLDGLSCNHLDVHYR